MKKKAPKAPKERSENKQIKRILAVFKVLARSRFAMTYEEIYRKLTLEYDIELLPMKKAFKTFSRDIDFIESPEGFGYPIGRLPGGGYILENTDSMGKALLPILFDPQELQALCMVRELLEIFRNTYIADSLESVYDKVARVFSGKTKIIGSLSDMEDAFLIQARRNRAFKNQKEIIKKITESILSKKLIKVTHSYPGKKTHEFDIQPYKLIIYDGSFYLLGIPQNFKDPDFRLYLLQRMKTVEQMDGAFKPVDTKVIEKKLQQAWGIDLSGKLTRIRITFDSELDGFLKERTWHSSQKFIKNPKGTVLELNILLNREITPWIRGFGKKVIGVWPKELETLYKAEM